MANLTTNRIHKTNPAAGRASYPIANGVTLGVGAFVQLSGGYLNHWDETGSFMGVVVGGDFDSTTGLLTGDTTAALPPEATVDTSGVTLMHQSSVAAVTAATDVGSLVFSADSDPDSATLTDTTNPPIGYLTRFRSTTDVDITLFTPGEHAAGIADATWNV